MDDGQTPADLDPTMSPDLPTDDAEPAIVGQPTVRRRPLSVDVISAILIVTGGALEGYAVALTASDSAGREYSLVWALLGAALVVTAWALRSRRWWGAAAAIAVSVVGLLAGMYGVYFVLVLADSPGTDPADWATAVGFVAIGAAAIAIIGLLSGVWGWLTAPTQRARILAGPSPTA